MSGYTSLGVEFVEGTLTTKLMTLVSSLGEYGIDGKSTFGLIIGCLVNLF